MDRRLGGLRLGLVLLVLGMAASAAFAEARGMGLRPPTAEEWARFEAVCVPVTSVEPNARALARWQAEVEAARQEGKTITTALGLPGVVDNSTLTYFPPIRSQGGQGAA